MTRRTVYRVAGESLLVEAQDLWATTAVEALFAGWYLEPDATEQHPAPFAPAIVVSSAIRPAPIPSDWHQFEIAGGGTCRTNGTASYIDIDGSIVAIGSSGPGPIEVRANGPLPLHAPALTRLVTYAVSAALRQRHLFELHSGALVHPKSERGVLVIGPSGSGKSTLTVHLATAGWSFLTDDVLVLSRPQKVAQPFRAAQVSAWPLRRCFAITSETFAASPFLQAQSDLDYRGGQEREKKPFVPQDVFGAKFKDTCIPKTLFFTELSGEPVTRVSRLSPGETMARLIRMSPWSCYDRSTAAQHLHVLSALVKQSTGYSLRAGKDMLDAERSAALIEEYASGGEPARV